MAKFTDLSNELVIAIASFIRKPADILHLCIAERRSHGIILPLLYENIVLHHLNYPTHGICLGRDDFESGVCSLLRLFWQQHRRFKRNGGRHGTNFGAECRSLAINMEHMGFPPPKMLQLFRFLPFLRYLSIISGGHRYDGWDRHVFQVGDFERALHPLHDTLETLTLFIGYYHGNKNGIRSLHRFKAMKQLSIQSHILLGRTDNWHRNGIPGPLLSQLLPPAIEDLTIHCCEFLWKEDIDHHFEASLDRKASMQPSILRPRFAGRDRRVIENVIVCRLHDPMTRYSAKAIASHLSRLESCFDIIGNNELGR